MFLMLTAKIKNLLSLYRNESIALAVVLVVASSFVVYKVISSDNQQNEAPKLEAREVIDDTPKGYSLPISGELVEDKEQTIAPINGFTYSNSVEARPQSGLNEADIVYEFNIENKATRLVALFQGDLPETIGPLRSLRTYFSDVAVPYQAALSHVGGDPAALAEVNQVGLISYNEFSQENFFYRAADRYAPHNLYTTGEKIDQLNEILGHTSSDFAAWPRSATPTNSSVKADGVHVSGYGVAYNPTFKYDSSSKKYVRYQNGEKHINNEDQAEIKPSVVIALKANHTILDADGHLGINLVGSGGATIFQNGEAIDASWSKTSRQTNFKFTDNLNQEIVLAQGQTWVAIVSSGDDLTYL